MFFSVQFDFGEAICERHQRGCKMTQKRQEYDLLEAYREMSDEAKLVALDAVQVLAERFPAKLRALPPRSHGWRSRLVLFLVLLLGGALAYGFD